MKLSRIVLVLSLATIICGTASAKRRLTPLSEGCKKAQVIVVADTISHEYDALPENTPTKVNTLVTWAKYRVTKIIKNEKKLAWLKPGTTLKITNHENGCYDINRIVVRKGDTLEFYNVKDPNGKVVRTASLKKMKAERKHSVALFLTENKTKNKETQNNQETALRNYGFGLSPKKWTKKLDSEIRDLLANK